METQRIVYILKNSDDPPRFYTGLTADLRARLEAHNAGRCSHTAQHRPWALDVVMKFADEARALKFEAVAAATRALPPQSVRGSRGYAPQIHQKP